VSTAAVPASAHRTAVPAVPHLITPVRAAATAGDGMAEQVRWAELAKVTAAARQAAARPATWTVRPGDSLSSIAAKTYGRPDAWPVLYWGNRHTVRWANQITAGQVLKVPAEPARIPAAPRQLEPAPPPRPVVTTAAEVTPAQAPAAASASTSASSGSYAGGTPGGSFGACVVARESGGNSQVMNSSGHYGLYQFSASTWAAYGGSSADFGHAPAAEQNQVFANALARGGQSNWSLYDGC
jgi:LysM repeat protein